MIHHGCSSIIGMINKHLRSIVHAPVHLTRIPTQDFFHSLGLPAPWHILQRHFDRLVQALNSRRSPLQGSAMSSQPNDAGMHVPAYPETPIPIPRPAPIRALRSLFSSAINATEHSPRLDRINVISGNTIRFHDPCNQKDLYNPLRDTTNGHPICSCLLYTSPSPRDA